MFLTIQERNVFLWNVAGNTSIHVGMLWLTSGNNGKICHFPDILQEHVHDYVQTGNKRHAKTDIWIQHFPHNTNKIRFWYNGKNQIQQTLGIQQPK